MNITLVQLQYALAVAQCKSFVKAAEACFVTQPTLSQQIQKLENQLGVMIFDRSQHPVEPTPFGQKVLYQALTVIQETKKIEQLIIDEQSSLSGEVRLGVIPTLAPFVIPRFLGQLQKKHPTLKIIISELTTENLITQLKSGAIDMGLLVTPLHDEALIEKPLYYETLHVFAHKNDPLLKHKKISENHLDLDRIYLLSEGHCFRDQVLNICRAPKSNKNKKVVFESSSLETLKRIVEDVGGFTILPFLATEDLVKKNQKNQLRSFAEPIPVRELSLVRLKSFHKEKIWNALFEVIKDSLPLNADQNKQKTKTIAIQSQ